MEFKTPPGNSSSFLVSTPTLTVLGLGLLLSLRLNVSLVAGLCLFFLLLGVLCRYWSARAMEHVTLRMECLRPRLFPGQETVIRYEVENE